MECFLTHYAELTCYAKLIYPIKKTCCSSLNNFHFVLKYFTASYIQNIISLEERNHLTKDYMYSFNDLVY